MSLKIRLIPCLDVKDGRVVKGVRFVDLQPRRGTLCLQRLHAPRGARRGSSFSAVMRRDVCPRYGMPDFDGRRARGGRPRRLGVGVHGVA